MGGVFAFLIIAVVLYVEYRRRKRRAVLQRFQLRRLRRKYKLKNAQRGKKGDAET